MSTVNPGPTLRPKAAEISDLQGGSVLESAILVAHRCAVGFPLAGSKTDLPYKKKMSGAHRSGVLLTYITACPADVHICRVKSGRD